MVFFGEFILSLTSGHRIVLPKKIREQIRDNKFILTKGFDFCLSGYRQKDWEQKAKELLDASLLDKSNMRKKRIIFSSAVYLEWDAQGRIILPKNLMEYAGIKEKVVIIGVGDHFEIWAEEAWKSYQQNTDDQE